MAKFTILAAEISHASQELKGAANPPDRMLPLELETEMLRITGLTADLPRLCVDLPKGIDLEAETIELAREELKKRVAALVVLTGTTKVVLNGGSTPYYRRLPDGSHWTEDWLQIQPAAGASTPWILDYPRKDPNYKVFPCLRVLLSAPY